MRGSPHLLWRSYDPVSLRPQPSRSGTVAAIEEDKNDYADFLLRRVAEFRDAAG
jgi:hypothetical protein